MSSRTGIWTVLYVLQTATPLLDHFPGCQIDLLGNLYCGQKAGGRELRLGNCAAQSRTSVIPSISSAIPVVDTA